MDSGDNALIPALADLYQQRKKTPVKRNRYSSGPPTPCDLDPVIRESRRLIATSRRLVAEARALTAARKR